MDGKQFRFRIRSVFAVLAALLLAFTWVLYDLQIVQGASYRERSQRKIAVQETVEAARGEILDRYGRVLVSNRLSYQVTLNVPAMGKEPARNANLLALLEICRAHDVVWPDTLPISKAAPFVYEKQQAQDTALARFDAFVAKMKWTEQAQAGADALMAHMRAYFMIDPAVSDEDARGLIGVLYEVNLRLKDIHPMPYLFAEDVGIDFITVVKERALVGVLVEAATVRQYNTPYAAHLLGRVGQMDREEWDKFKTLGYAMDDTVGKEGVELAFEAYLRGEAGKRMVETNQSGKVVSESWLTDLETGEVLAPKPGSNVMLTLDIRLQEAVERALAEFVPTRPTAEGAAAVVIDVKSGGTLALASYPTFDLRTLYSDTAHYQAVAENPLKPLFNRATMGTYAPGSTFKMVTAIAGLEEGIITPQDKILDTGKYTYYQDVQPQCWIYRQYGGTHGLQNVTQAITNSCNVFFFDVGRRLGIDTIGQYAQKFGLGAPTGIELPEDKGVIAGPAYTQSIGQTWYDGNTLSAAIGQENNRFTPLQTANYVATLVNGGQHYQAHLLQSVKSNDFSAVVEQYEPVVLDTVEIAPTSLKAVKAGMLEVTTTGGPSPYFKNLTVPVGAKTGSAQVAANSEANAVFVCFAPYDDPEIAMAIMVEKGGSGTELGAVAADILEYYFNAERTLEAVDGENSLLR